MSVDREFASLSARDFAALLKRGLGIEGPLMGHDQVLGHEREREGDSEYMTEIAKERLPASQQQARLARLSTRYRPRGT